MVKIKIIKMKKCIFAILVLISSYTLAETCPAPSEIKARDISKNYDWSVEESITLEELVNVEALFGVRIKNKNQYIACYYRGKEKVIRLDGLPLGKNCRVYHESTNWQVTEKHEWFCNAEDKYQCIYEKKCSE